MCKIFHLSEMKNIRFQKSDFSIKQGIKMYLLKRYILLRSMLHGLRKESKMKSLARFRLYILGNVVDRFSSKPIVLTRVACLGEEMILSHRRISSIRMKNFQKGRIDYLLTQDLNRSKLIKSPFVIDEKVFGERLSRWTKQLYKQNFWEIADKTRILVIDTFSEFTDTKYILDNKFMYFAHNSDLNNLSELSKRSLKLSLYQLDNYESDLEKLLNRIKSGVNVIVIHYSATNDERDFFRQRARQMEEIFVRVQLKYKNIHFIKIPDELYAVRQGDSFPYHYGEETMKILNSQMGLILEEFGLKKSKYLPQSLPPN